MPIGLLGTKIGMTQVYNDEGKVYPVTVIKLGPCPVLQVRDLTRDGYDAVQIGFEEKPRRKATKAERGHISSEMESNRRKKAPAGTQYPPKANCEPQKYIREFRLEKASEELTVGKVLTVDEIFKDIKYVDVIGTTKGRGFAGRRFRSEKVPRSDDVHDRHRTKNGPSIRQDFEAVPREPKGV